MQDPKFRWTLRCQARVGSARLIVILYYHPTDANRLVSSDALREMGTCLLDTIHANPTDSICMMGDFNMTQDDLDFKLGL